MTARKRYKEINFIRAVCCIWILVYHFSTYTLCSFKPLLRYCNGYYGEVVVTVFFIVSGFVIYNNNRTIQSVSAFYKKRVRSIFPSFYLCWLIFYIMKAAIHKNVFYFWEEPWKLVFTILGIDGYFLGLYPNFYLVGEWFLGALIFCYLAYPVLLKLANENPLLLFSSLLCLFLIFKNSPLKHIPHEYTDIFEYFLKFYIGMILRKNEKLLYRQNFAFICLMYFLVFTFVRIGDFCLLVLIYGVALFEVLFFIGGFFSERNKIITFISSLSYPIYLIHHQIILKVFRFIGNSTNVVLEMLELMIVICCTLLMSVFVKYIVDYLDSQFLKKNKSHGVFA